MQYEDRLTIATPEGVELELTLAGLGSRFIAAMIDTVIQWLVIAAIAFPFGLAGSNTDPAPEDTEVSALVGVAVVLVLVFLIMFGYHVLFETLSSGRTPGKRWTGLRVLRSSGHPVGFTASAVRNLLRLVDGLPAGYAVGTAFILFSRTNQRLGDIAAGTVVVRDQGRRRQRYASPDATPRPFPNAEAWDVSAITPTETATVRRFMERRSELSPEARTRIAIDLAQRLAPKVSGTGGDVEPERFLEQVVLLKASRS